MSGVTADATPSSVSRRAAFSVASSLRHAARRILQRGRHRVPAIHHDRAVGVGPQAVAAGALEALAPLDLLAGGARFGAGTGPAGGWS